MNEVRRARLSMAAVVPLALLGGALALVVGYDTLAVIFACLASIGVLGYRLVPRYAYLYEIPTEVDRSSSRTLFASLYKLAIFCAASVTLGYFWVVFDWVTVATLVGPPPTLPLAALSVLPGVFLGAGVPLLAQRDIVFHRLEGSQTGQFVGNTITFGSLLSLLTWARGAVSGFVAAYVVSRLAVLVGWQVAAGD